MKVTESRVELHHRVHVGLRLGERPVAARWPSTRASWRRLKLAFAGCLHAWADRIETADHEQATKE